MDMDQSAVFLAGSILVGLGFIVVIATVVIINNLLHKYWKPVRFFIYDSLAHKQYVDSLTVQHNPSDIDKTQEPPLK